jgi:hypothetical protein
MEPGLAWPVPHNGQSFSCACQARGSVSAWPGFCVRLCGAGAGRGLSTPHLGDDLVLSAKNVLRGRWGGCQGLTKKLCAAIVCRLSVSLERGDVRACFARLFDKLRCRCTFAA